MDTHKETRTEITTPLVLFFFKKNHSILMAMLSAYKNMLKTILQYRYYIWFFSCNSSSLAYTWDANVKNANGKRLSYVSFLSFPQKRKKCSEQRCAYFFLLCYCALLGHLLLCYNAV